jgi:hypothetical protein
MSSERETVTEAKAEVVSDKQAETLVDAVFDIGLAWAEFGVSQGRRALETSAKTLEKVAQTLGDLQEKLRKDAAASPRARA